MADILATIRGIVWDETGTESELDGGTRLDNVSGWDSVAMASVLMAIEDRFDLTIDRDQLDGVQSFGDLVRLVVAGHSA